MHITVWDHINERHSEKLTHTQRTIRHGIVSMVAIALGASLKMPIDALLGHEVKPDQWLQFAGAGVLVSVVYTAVDLVRGPRTAPAPDLTLTDEMRRRVR